MSKNSHNKDYQSVLEDIHIDYQNIDVKDIMDQIKTLIAKRIESPDRESEPEAGSESFSSPNDSQTGTVPAAPSRIKTLILKLMKPFSPLVKLLILPVYQELRETVVSLDLANQRLDRMGQSVNDINAHSLETSRKLDQDMPFLKEYTRLLYNLAHNMVIEMTKLKIEEENLKIRIRILEKDFENLKSRERALESRIL